MKQEGSTVAMVLGVGPWDGIKRAARARMGTIGRLVGATGVSPNALTLFGLALNVAAAGIVVTGNLFLGGVAFLFASAFDMLDGAVARATGRTSRFGAFLDSVVDRYDESAIFVGLLVVASQTGDTVLVIVTSMALVGSLLVSYTRARAEGLGLDCEIGWLQRPERVILLGVGLVFAQFALVPIVWGLAIVTNFTAVQRVLHVRKLLEAESESGDRSS